MFVTSIVWAAYHFTGDISSNVSEYQVPLSLSFRILTCLALGFVFGWLTLRSGSVLPATVAHTLYNVFIYADFGPPFTGKSTARVVLWAILALLLFSHFPVAIKATPSQSPILVSKSGDTA